MRKLKVIKKFTIIALLLCALLTFSGAGNITDENYVYLGGVPIGIELDAVGVVVEDTFNVLSDAGVVAPAKQAGIIKNDVIMSINGREVYQAKDISDVLCESGAKSVEVKLLRDKKEIYTDVLPVYDVVTKTYRIGVSVSQGISGVGTLTFVTKEGKFGGLGHGISDDRLKSQNLGGNIYKCSVFEIIKGKKGCPGELHGMFHSTAGCLGAIFENNACGVFGNYTADTSGMTAIPVARQDEIRCGDAYIFSTLSGDVPRRYEIEIEKIVSGAVQKGIVIKVVDKRLLSASGGIVRGMSGSPIVQNGKLVGAITHVLVNDPTRGYGIFIENMLDKAK